MPIKISKAVKDLNIGMQTARDFLKKNEIEVDDNINARISDEAYNLLIQKFKPAMQQKKAAEQIIHDRKEEKAAQAAEKKRREAEESKTVEVAIQKPKVLGKIELDAKGNPVAPKPAAPEAPKAEEVKMEEKKAKEEQARISQYFIRICELVFHVKYGIRCAKCGKVYDYQEFLIKALDKEHPFHCECFIGE